MEQIKHKLGDLVYVVCDDGNHLDFKITYGVIVNIHHKMEECYRTYLEYIQEDGEYDCDTLRYDVLNAHNEIVNALSWEVFDTIPDALDVIRGTVQRAKIWFENAFNSEVASDTE
jgi:hypothetical protein